MSYIKASSAQKYAKWSQQTGIPAGLAELLLLNDSQSKLMHFVCPNIVNGTMDALRQQCLMQPKTHFCSFLSIMDTVLRGYAYDESWHFNVSIMLQQPLPYDTHMGSYWNADNGYSDKYAYPRIDLNQQLRHTYAIMPTSNFSLMVECNKRPQWRGHFYLHCHQRLLAEHCNCQLASLSPTVTTFYDDDYMHLPYCTL